MSKHFDGLWKSKNGHLLMLSDSVLRFTEIGPTFNCSFKNIKGDVSLSDLPLRIYSVMPAWNDIEYIDLFSIGHGHKKEYRLVGNVYFHRDILRRITGAFNGSISKWE